MPRKLTSISSSSIASVLFPEETPDISRFVRRAKVISTVNFVRAARLLDEASEADPVLRRALESPYVAVDTFGRILGISAECARILGFAQSSFIGRRLVHKISGGDRVAFLCAMVRFRSNRQPFKLPLSVRGKDGVLRPLTLSLAACGGGKNAVVVLRVAIDNGASGGIKPGISKASMPLKLS